MPRILGIDGGGTKTIAVVADGDPHGSWHALGQGTAGPSNPQTVGFRTAAETIVEAVRAAMANAVSSDSEGEMHFDAACFCVAGVGRAADEQQLAAQLQTSLALGAHQFVHDGWATLAAAWPDAVGMALIAGTGSLAFGRTRDGRKARAGGWGYLLGDEGSAFWIAMVALRAVVRATDGRAPRTELIDEALHHFEIRHVSELVHLVYATPINRRRIAGFAPRVFACESDPIARQIILTAADQLASHIHAVAEQLTLAENERRVALSGGVLTGQASLRQLLTERLEPIGIDAAQTKLIEQPVNGALELASKLSSGPSSFGR